MKFGIIQGRLTPSITGELQCFPTDHWEVEFSSAKKSGYDFIEFIVEEHHNAHNPLWSDNGIDRIKELSIQHQLDLFSVCNDYVITHPLLSEETQNQLQRLIIQSHKCGLTLIVLPLFKQSQISLTSWPMYVDVLTRLGNLAKDYGIRLALETDLDGKELLGFMKQLNHPFIGCVYDTGNSIGFDHDIYGDIQLLNDFVWHVHIKDKNSFKKNVLLGEGDVSFEKIIGLISKSRSVKTMTFETARGKDPIMTAHHHQHYIEQIWRKHQDE